MSSARLEAAATAVEPAHQSIPDGPACLIINPRSFRLSRGQLAARARATAERLGATVVEAREPAAFSRALEDFLPRRPRMVAILGGDGTVQATVTHLAKLAPPAGMPPLLVLGGGRTNLTAHDLGQRSTLLRRLEKALSTAPDELQTTMRHTLRIQQSPALDEHGFFVAGAVVDSVIRDCHAHQQSGHGLHRNGPLSTAWRLMQIGVLSLLGRMRFASPELRLQADGLGELAGPTRVLVVTTLTHQQGLLNPYDDGGQGVIRVTAIRNDAQGFWWRLPRILTGRFHRRMQPATGYLSGHCEGLRIHGLAGFALDGQEYDTDPEQPVTVTPGPEVRFIRT